MWEDFSAFHRLSDHKHAPAIRAMPQAAGGSWSKPDADGRSAQTMHDELLALREANIALKRSNLSKEEEVRRYAVKMERIKHGLAQQATSKETIAK